MKCAIARAAAATRPAHSTSKWQRFIQLMHKRARMNPGSDPVTIDVCAAPPPVCHFVSVTFRNTYCTVSEAAPKHLLFELETRSNGTLTVQMTEQHTYSIIPQVIQNIDFFRQALLLLLRTTTTTKCRDRTSSELLFNFCSSQAA